VQSACEPIGVSSVLTSIEDRISKGRLSTRLQEDEILSIIEAEAGPKSREVLQEALKYESPSHTSWGLLKFPVVVSETKGAIVTDVDGKEYIDCMSAFGVLNVGGCHPKVVQAARSQVEKSTVYCELPSEARVQLAKKLTGMSPVEGRSKVHFCVTGTEAVAGAVRAAGYFTGRPSILAFYGCYHGRVGVADNLTRNAYMKNFAFPVHATEEINFVPYAYCYRCAFGKEYPDCDMQCTRHIEQLLSNTMYGLRDHEHHISHLSAIIVEPVQGHAGVITPPTEFMRDLRRICDQYGLLLLDDEIYTGFGRTGKLWAIEHSGVKADIITIGKSLAGGYPISAIVGKEEIMNSWGPYAVCGTFMGNLLSSATSLAAIQVIDEEKLVERASSLGEYMLKGLRSLQQENELIGDVGGHGLFMGIEFVKDRKTKQPAYEETTRIQHEARKRGVLIAKGAFGNRIDLMPPLVIEKDQIDRIIEVLDAAIKAAK